MKEFSKLTTEDVEKLRRKKAVGIAQYHYSAEELEQARQHLQKLYPNCRVQSRFAATILLLNKLN